MGGARAGLAECVFGGRYQPSRMPSLIQISRAAPRRRDLPPD